MFNERLRDKWRRGEVAVDCWLTGTSPTNSELIGRMGFDSVVVDMQHTMAGFSDVGMSILALTGTNTTVLVRVPGNDPLMVQRILDAGADGVMCPMVNNREEAEKFVSAVRYPPLGTRSVGAYRVAGDMLDYFRQANRDYRRSADRDGRGDVEPGRHRLDPRSGYALRWTRRSRRLLRWRSGHRLQRSGD